MSIDKDIAVTLFALGFYYAFFFFFFFFFSFHLAFLSMADFCFLGLYLKKQENFFVKSGGCNQNVEVYGQGGLEIKKLKVKRSKNNEEKKFKSQEQAKFVINNRIIDIRAALTSTEECLPFQNNELRLFKVNNGITLQIM